MPKNRIFFGRSTMIDLAEEDEEDNGETYQEYKNESCVNQVYLDLKNYIENNQVSMADNFFVSDLQYFIESKK